MKKQTKAKATKRVAAAQNLLGEIDLNRADLSQDVLDRLQNIVATIQNTVSLSPRFPFAEIPNGGISLDFLDAANVSASSTIASWDQGGIGKKEKEFKSKSLRIRFPVNRKFQVVFHVLNTSATGFFFIEKEENKKRKLIKKVKFNAPQGALIPFAVETTSNSDSQDVYISFRQKDDADSRFEFWSMDFCNCTELFL